MEHLLLPGFVLQRADDAGAEGKLAALEARPYASAEGPRDVGTVQCNALG